MKQHLIVLDLDGTLLSSDLTILPKTKKTLRRLIEDGHIVIIATGRPFRASFPYYKELQLKTPIVNFNGAFTHHPLDLQWAEREHVPIDLHVALDIVDYAEQKTMHNMIAEVLDDVYLAKEDERLMPIFNYGNPTLILGHLKQSLQDHPTNLLLYMDRAIIDDVERELAEDFHATISQHQWGGPFPIIEIVRSGLHKARGIRRVARYYNIPQERIIAFGDERNDVEMIEDAGIGVAMGNAYPPLKQIADYVTKTNDEEGIAFFLQGYFYADEQQKQFD